MPAPSPDADPLILYKTATTLFLGIGVASVFQTRLVSSDVKISTRGERTWRTVDLVASGAVLVLIAAGVLLAQTVVARGDPQGEEDLTIKILLGITAGWVVLKLVIQETLRIAWTSGMATSTGRVVAAIAAALAGFALGGAVLLAVIFRSGITLWLPSLIAVVVGVAATVVVQRFLVQLYPALADAGAEAAEPVVEDEDRPQRE